MIVDGKSLAIGAILAWSTVSLMADARTAHQKSAPPLNCGAPYVPTYLEQTTTEKQLSEIIDELNGIRLFVCATADSSNATVDAIYETRR